MHYIKIQKLFVFFIIFVFIFSSFVFLSYSQESTTITFDPPLFVDMSIDEIIQRRTSIREFFDTPISTDELSTILWNAYGVRSDGSRTIPTIVGEYACIIYVLMDIGIYRYDPFNHSLVFYKNGDYRSIGQYNAPIQLGICWDTSKNNDENIVGMQIGAIGQNIYHTSIALNLGTVTTAEVPSPLDRIGLPDGVIGRIVMPIGNPIVETKYFKLPMWISFLPRIKDSGIALTSTIQNWNQSKPFTHTAITRQDLSQFLWACYGYSYYLDHSGFEMHFIERHRTVPSAHAYYPLQMYVMSSDGVYRYIPGIRNNDPFGLPIITFLWKIKDGDFRSEIASITNELVESAPLSIIITLNVDNTIDWDDLSDCSLRWIWTYEAGSCAQNVILNTEAWDYSTKIISIENLEGINSILGLKEKFEPFYILPIG